MLLWRVTRPRAGLQAVEAFVQATVREQLAMRPALANLSAMQQQDLVGVDDRAETMCDSDRRAPGHELAQRAMDLGFDLAVDGARGFIEHEHRGVRRDGARER